MIAIKCLAAACLVACLSGTASAQQEAAAPRGLCVHDGTVTLSGQPYRGIGANYFSLFVRKLADPSDTSTEEGLRQLARAGIPFVRFPCAGFWPVDWDLYFKDKNAYFARLDGIVRTAEQCRMGLIPSFFWYTATVPDLVGEPLDQLGNAQSKTCAFIRRYTEEVVSRYKDSPALWAWEFGNEYHLSSDLPNAIEHRPYVVPSRKTATTRTARDDLHSEHVLIAFGEFAKAVRQHDRQRMILTGNSIPRPTAYHNTLERSWKADTPEQFKQVLLRDNPDPFDAISIHVYPDKAGRYPLMAPTVSGLIKAIHELAVASGKPLFIGEFGAPISAQASETRAAFEEILTAIETCKVPLSAFWVFDLPNQNKDWNVTFRNERAYMIDLVAQANARLKKSK